MNALGVIAKVDLSVGMLARRHELATKVHSQLEDRLNDVVPVSAALARALDHVTENQGELLTRFVEVARRIAGPQLDLLLQSPELFAEFEPEGCAVPAVARRRLWEEAGCEWRVFVTILEEARGEGTTKEVASRLRELAGFDRLRRTLREHFLERAEILRCHRIVSDARALLRRRWFEDVVPLRRDAGVRRARLNRLLAFVDAAPGDPEMARELRAFLRDQLDDGRAPARLEAAWQRVDGDLAALGRRLGEANADFAALHDLEASPGSFSDDEGNELRALLGLYGSDVERRLRGDRDVAQAVERQLRWRVARDRAPRGSRRAAVADRAHARLGLVLAELQSA
jgi:hypothetical protein